jgi:alpha-N-arabinofuranosidase
MDMYTVHHDALLLPVSVRSAMYTLGERSLPALSVSASRDGGGATHISLVNIDLGHPQDVVVEIHGAAFTSVSGRILVSGSVEDHNTFDDPARVKPAEFGGARLDAGNLHVQLPPCSVVVLTLK